MSIPLYGSVGALFNRLGRLGKTVSQLGSYQQSQLMNLVDTTAGITAQYNAESDLQALIGNSYISMLNNADSVGSQLQSLALLTVNRMVYRAQPQLNQTLQNQNILASLQQVILQMQQQGATVLAMTVTGTPAAFTGVGNGVINVSTKRPIDGLTLENTFSEQVLFTCTSSSYNNSATAGNEAFRITGTGNQTNPFAFDYPLGSNATGSLNAIDGNTDNGSGNLLTNSGFSNWTNNVPNNYVLAVGAGGVNVFREASITYDSPYAMRWTGDVSNTLVSLSQLFNDSTGTLGTLKPQTQYGFNVFLRRGGTGLSTAVLEIALVDSNGTILQDAAGINNVLTVALSGMTTVYTSNTTQFRTPVILPSSVYLRLRLTTALPSGTSLYLDKMSMGSQNQLYTSGPYFCVHAGSVPFEIGDYGYCAMVNSRGAGGSMNTFQSLLPRLLPQFITNELLLPSSATPNVSDLLITA